MNKDETIITQNEVDAVWGNANFGGMDRMDVVKYGLLTCAGGFYQGYTSTCILKELGLISLTKKGNVLALKGKRNLYNFF